jgi:putative hydrolase of the HAD superfamily
MLKTLIFDLGKVIVPFDFQRGYQAMAERTGLAPEEVRTRIAATNTVAPYESGLMETPEFVGVVNSALGQEFAVDEFQLLWSTIFLPDTLLPESLFESLKHRYRLVLLSNTNDLHFRFIRERYPLLRHMDEFVLSYRAKAAKPDPRIYQAAIAAARCRPEECFFTDDIPDYVAGARAAGIQAVQFQGYDSLLESLREHGVAI